MRTYDLIIIGLGPGGYAAALHASRFKISVCVIEKAELGGTCLNRGCIPTKAMLHSASILSVIKESKEYGIEVSGVTVNFPAIAARRDMTVTRLRAGIESLLKANKIDLVRGNAKLTGSNAVTVDGKKYSAKNVIIAAGSVPMALPGMPFDEERVCSSDGFLNLKDIPKSIVIAGAGVIGCEFASLFNAFGSKVTIIELLDRLLPAQSKEVSGKLQALFRKRGIEVRTSAKFEPCPEFQKILVAVGRRPNTGSLGLEEAGVKTEDGRIVVDKNLRTAVKNIYAIGDCVDGPLLAHKASYDGILAVDNILGVSREADYSNVPNCIWTSPEIASVGLTEEDAKAKYPDARIAKFPYLASGKARIMGRQEGFVKIIGDAKGNILGVEIFGEEACDLIGEAVLARSLGVNIKDWARVIHGHPTLSEMFQEAARAFTVAAK